MNVSGDLSERESERTVGEHVRQHAELVVYRRGAPDEHTQLLRDRPHAPPVDERVEDQLVAPVRALLPSIELVVARQRHALLEPALAVRRPPDDVPTQLGVNCYLVVARCLSFQSAGRN